MAHSFSATSDGALADLSTSRRAVLVTGAAGRIGSCFTRTFHDKYDLRLQVENEEQAQQVQQFGDVVIAELSEIEKLKDACEGIDTVLHLAGNPDANQVWSSILENNIIGTYHTFVAAKAAGCRRVVYASSIHAVSGYPVDVQVKTSEPVNPGDLYGVSKAFGEALGRYMAEKEGLSVIALRIGAFGPIEKAERPNNISEMDGFVSERDLMQLIEKSIDSETIRWAVFHGLSNNRFKRLDISDARELLGYEPQDDFTELNPELHDLHISENVASHSAADQPENSGLREELVSLEA